MLEMEIEALGSVDNIIMNLNLDFSLEMTYTLLKATTEINLDLDNEAVLNSDNDNYDIPGTRNIMGIWLKY